LKKLGATEVVGREYAHDDSKRPLLKPLWAGAIDTVGGEVLATLLKGCKRHGNVAACGLVLSPKLPTSVFPFILNGINLLGIDSERCTMPVRKQIWQKLATDWRVDDLEEIGKFIKLEELEAEIQRILKGKVTGRVVVDLR
ncbi:MAG: oxidoreductase, partial [Bacteroidota bacterium]